MVFQCIHERSNERNENEYGEEGREWRLSDLLDADDFVLYGKSEEELRAMVGRFVVQCRRMVLKGEEILEYEVLVGDMQLEHVSEFKCLGVFC